MHDEPEPPRQTFVFKPKEFERLNQPTPNEPVPPANDIFAIQRDLRQREIASGRDELSPPTRPARSRRRRDFWLLLVLGNGALVTIGVVARLNPVVLVYAFAGVVLFTIGLIWTMWFVMDDY